MGNISSPSSSDARNVDFEPQRPTDAQAGPTSQRNERGASEEESRQQPQDKVTVAQHAVSSQFDMPSSSPDFGHQGPYDMTPLASAFPPASYGHGLYYHPALSPPMLPQMPPGGQYTGPPPMPMIPQGYYFQQPHIVPYYAAGQHSSSQVQSTIPWGQSIAYYLNPVVMTHPQAAYYYSLSTQYPAQAQNIPAPMAPSQYATGNSLPSEPPAFSQSPEASGTPFQSQCQKPIHDEERRKSAVRGPPRKPRQNGHAVWIGNLPPQTDLMSLVHHVSKETKGLESLFIITKSNCAFANFKDEESCAAAQQKLSESKFQSVRLVSRLRKSTVKGTAGVAAPTLPATYMASISGPIIQTQGRPPADTGSSSSISTANATGQPMAYSPGEALSQDRFFILKSLTVEDLELSVRAGIWATQSHNEETLNNAFKKCDNVYLVFSANKSGEYYGYARMASEINQDPDAAIEFTPTSQPTSDPELPKAIPADANEYVPKGWILDDSDRGTAFWEIQREDSESGSDDESEVLSDKSTGFAPEEDDRTRGKPFRLEWLSTGRLPFCRTRGMRNPWNSNREVKIARDGTELEPSVGRRLIGLFTRVQSPRSPAATRPSMARRV